MSYPHFFAPLKALLEPNIQHFKYTYDQCNQTQFWIKDVHGKYLHANQAQLAKLGQSCIDDIIGKQDSDFLCNANQDAQQTDINIFIGSTYNRNLALNKNAHGDMSWLLTNKSHLKEGGHTWSTAAAAISIKNLPEKPLAYKPVLLAAQYMLNNYHQKISMEEIASIACVSISTLERQFKKNIGKTPSRFIYDIRLEAARSLICETAIPVSKIAEKTGFCDHSYFTKIFTKSFGVPPVEYRLRINNLLRRNNYRHL